MSTQMVQGPGVGIAKEEFGSRSLERKGETSSTALAAAAQAQVQARYIMAMQRPRSWDEVRIRLLNECRRYGFAASARFKKPVGGGNTVDGPSIRFAEACLRFSGNMGLTTNVLYDDAEKRVLEVVATDFETNASCSSTITVGKTVERSSDKGRDVIAQRLNSYGKTVFIVRATDDEAKTKENAEASKAGRVAILRLIPADIVEECMTACIKTVEAGLATDPAAARKAVCDGFAGIGIMPTELERYLGHPVESMTPHELAELRAVFATIQAGEETWKALLEAKTGDPEAATEEAKTATQKVTAKIADMKAKREAAKKERESSPNGAAQEGGV